MVLANHAGTNRRSPHASFACEGSSRSARVLRPSSISLNQTRGKPCVVKPASRDEFEAVALLRAEAYYEDERSRFRASYIKKFVYQEVDSLTERTASSGKRPPVCECLIAVEDEEVVGCLDLRPPASTNEGLAPSGVPLDDLEAGYVLNVVVKIEKRGEGIGRALMEAAMSRAMTRWEAKGLYTHVAGDNDVARKLYLACGFSLYSLQAAGGVTGVASLGLGSMIHLHRSLP